MNPIIVGMGISSAAIMAGTLLYLASLRDAGPGLYKWAMGLAFLALNGVAFILMREAAGERGALLMSQALHLGGALLILAGTRSFSGKDSMRLVAAAGTVSLLTLLAVASVPAISPPVGRLLFQVVGGIVLLLAAADMLRSGIGPRESNLFVGGVLAVWGIVTGLLAPTLETVDAHWGVFADQALGWMTAVGLIILALRRQSTDLERAREDARRAGREASEHAEHVRNILDALPDGVMVVDGKGLIRDFNPSAEGIFGYETDQVVGRDAGLLLPVKGGGASPGGLVALLGGRPDGASPRGETLYGLRRDGTRVPVELSVNKTELGGEMLLIGLVRDISDTLMAGRLDNFLHSLDRRVLHGRSPEDLDTDICEEACAAFDLPLCTLLSWDGAGLEFRAAAGVLDPEAVATALTDILRRPDAIAPLVEAIQAASVRVITGSAAGRIVRLMSGRFDWVIVMPLHQQGEVSGVLMAIGRADQPEEELVDRLETLGARVGAARQSVHDQRQLRLQGTAMAAAANAIFITDRDGRIEWVNEAFTRLSGFPAQEAIGKDPSLLRSGVQDEETYQRLWDTIRRGDIWRGEMVERRKDGSLYTVDQTVAPILDDSGEIAHFVAVHEDVTERKRAEERILYLSNYDSLTRLPNRVLFRDHLYQSVSHARQTRGALAVLFIDLDRFSRVNDTLGHHVGDQLLMIVASRINAAAAQYAETIARIGGDEFAIIQSRLPNADAAGALARRVVEAVNQPTDLDGIEVRVGANVGIAIFPQDGEDPDHLIKNADMAMYRAIRSETESIFFFSNDMNDEARIRLSLEGDLRKALNNGDLSLFYQPQIDVKTRKVVGCEALLRWNHPEHGAISPARFIPVAEDSGLILPIGEWVLEQALRQSRAWRDAGLPDITMAVNISAVQFRQQGLVGRVRQTIESCGVDPRRVELELTESMLMQDAREAVQVLTTLSDLGAQLAIDDFGTGYSSLSYLKQFPVDKLKLDQSFVRHLNTDPNDAVIARATINLGHSLGLEVIAEGVETEEQYDYLRAEGCDVIQGYLFGRPMPNEDMAALLARQGAASASAVSGIVG